MKDIKFKAIYKPDIENGKVIIFEQKEIDSELFFVNGDLHYDFAIPFLDKDWILLQYTGLKDIKDKEAIQYDLIVYPDKYRNNGKPIKIIWKDGSWQGKYIPGDFTFILNEGEMERTKIIGNVFQNLNLQ